MKLALEPMDTCQLAITGAPGIGRMRLWLPEGILSSTGASSVYPTGNGWTGDSSRLAQTVTEEQLIGGGNCPLVDEQTFECCGFRFPLDSPVRWHTEVWVEGESVKFSIKLTNTGEKTIRKAGAAVCLKFEEADWWSDDRVFVLSEGKTRSLSELGRGAGVDDVFEAYLMRDETFDHPFYIGFWGFNDSRLDAPVMVSENPDAGVCVEVRAEKAFFLHSNRMNPCTDLMLAFGDLTPGETRMSSGEVRVCHGSAADSL